MKLSTDCPHLNGAKPIPPLSQSRHGDMACETLYVHKHVQGTRLAESEPAARGIEIHQVLASYIDHLVRTRRATDLEVFDALMQGTGEEAREVLEKFRANHSFDPEKILATEVAERRGKNLKRKTRVSAAGRRGAVPLPFRP